MIINIYYLITNYYNIQFPIIFTLKPKQIKNYCYIKNTKAYLHFKLKIHSIRRI